MPACRPRSLSVLSGLLQASAALCVALACFWQTGHAGLSLGLAAACAVLAWAQSDRGRADSVRAVCASPDAGSWRILLADGWRRAELLAVRRGSASLTLAMSVETECLVLADSRKITCTIWRPMLLRPVWRHFCLLAETAQRNAVIAHCREAS